MLDLALCSFVMDRGEMVEEVLNNWLKHNIFKYVIIVDWDSRTPLYNFLKRFLEGSTIKNVYIVRALNREIFYITKARNLCMKFMKYEFNPMPSYTLMIDSDVLLPIDGKKIQPCGLDTILWDNSQNNLYGTVLMPTKAFWDINGYYEKITYWCSDIDFINRVGKSGYKVIDNGLNGSLSHISHVAVKENNRLIKYKGTLTTEEVDEWQAHGTMEQLDVEVYYPDGTLKKMKL